MLLLPAIDLRHGQCVRLQQGRKETATVYDTDPIRIALDFAASGVGMLHVVDLDGAFGELNSPNRAVAGEIIARVGIPVQFGGGLRDVSGVREMIDAGAQQVVLGTIAAESLSQLDELVRAFGAAIAVAIDARYGTVVTHGWKKPGKVTAVELARRVVEAGVRRIIYTDVAADGMLGGVSLDQTRGVAQAACVPVTASGGVASLLDLGRVREAATDGIDSVIVGKALYEGRFTLAEALRVSAGDN
jgi:phosphoribosylformimino-5-aminoimidazole carboxamide ribotide isomerase